MSQDRIVGIAALALGVALYWLAGDSQAYLFPRSIAAVIGLLGFVIAGSTWIGIGRPAASVARASYGWRKVLPVLALFVAYRWAMESVGFYVSAFAAFLIIVWLYAPEPASARVAVKRIAISGAFVAAIFALFSILLNVQTPRGMLF